MSFRNITILKARAGKGWKTLILKCLQEMDEVGVKITITDIRETLGCLSVYYQDDYNKPDNPKFVKILTKYIQQSYKTCENCGSTEKVSTRESKSLKRIKTFCEECHKEKP